MAGRKVENNHKIVESAAEISPAESLIAQQGDPSEEYDFGEAEETKEGENVPDEAPTEKKETLGVLLSDEIVAVASERKVILVGAASYYGCGKRFLKNVAETVDEESYGKLLSTGFFIGE